MTNWYYHKWMSQSFFLVAYSWRRKLLVYTQGMWAKFHTLLEPQHTQWPTLSCAYIIAWEETWESRTLIVEEGGSGWGVGRGGRLYVRKGGSPFEFTEFTRGLTHSSPSCSLSLSLSFSFSFSFSFSLSTMVDLNNLSHIIYLSTSLSHSLSHTNTLAHTRTDMQLSPHPHKHAHTHMPRGVGSWGWCGVSKLESAQRETW